MHGRIQCSRCTDSSTSPPVRAAGPGHSSIFQTTSKRLTRGIANQQFSNPAGSRCCSHAAYGATEAVCRPSFSSHRTQQLLAFHHNRPGMVARLCMHDAEQDKQQETQPSLSSEQLGFRHSEAGDAPKQSEQQWAGQWHVQQRWLQPVSSAYSRLKRQLRIQPSRRHDADIAAIAGPALLSLAADPLLSLVDTAFVGRLGPAELGALGVNTSLFAFSFVVCNFLSNATTPLVAGALASGDNRQAGRVTLQALAVAAVLGTAIALALTWGAEPALSAMGADLTSGPLHDLSLEYLRIRATAAPAALVMLVGQGVLRGQLDTKTPLMVVAGCNAFHLVLDPLLIFGAGWGVSGAAAATAAAEWAAAAAYLGCLWRRREQLGLWPLPSTDLVHVGGTFVPFIKAGSAMLARSVLLLGTKTMASAVSTRLGTVPIATHQVLMQLWMLSSFLLDSLAVGGQTLVAVHVGRDTVAAREISDRLLELGLGFGLGIAAAYTAAAPWLPLAFTDDADVVAAVWSLLPLVIGMLPLNSLVYVLDGVLLGASDFKFLAGAMAIAAPATVAVLLAVEVGEGGSLLGVWQGLAFLSLARLTTLMWRYQDDAGPLPPCVPGRSLPKAAAKAPDGTAFQHIAADSPPASKPPAQSNGAADVIVNVAAAKRETSTTAVSNIVPQQHKKQRRIV